MSLSRTAAIAQASRSIHTSNQGRGHIVISPATDDLSGPTRHSCEMSYWQARHYAGIGKAGLACELMGMTSDQASSAMYDVESGKCDWREAVRIAATVKHGSNGNAPADCLCNACTAGMGESRD
jgi:hypothetical protein